MSFSSLFQQYPQLNETGKAPLSEINTAEPIFLITERMDGSKKAIYYFNLISLLDEVFLKDSSRFLSIDQERFMRKFFDEANTVTGCLNNNVANPYNYISEIMLQLDSFLGSYFGDDYDRPA